MTKALIATEKSKKQIQKNNKKRHRNFDYTTTADRLRTVSWSDQTSVIKPGS